MAVTWDKALYDAAYDISGPGRRYHYERTVLFPLAQIRAQRLISIFGLDGTHRVVIFGNGFGWTDEALRNLGIDAIGCDDSPYIQSDWNLGFETSSSKKPLNERGNNGGSWNRIRQEFAGNQDPTHVFSEDLLTSLSDAEISVIDSWDNFASGSIFGHCTTTLNDGVGTQQTDDFPTWNWKTDAGWRTIFNANNLSAHRLFGPSWSREF